MLKTLGQRFPVDEISRESYLFAVSTWLRWRGHLMPESLFSQRLPATGPMVPWKQLREVSRQVGLDLRWSKPGKQLPPRETFPRLAVLPDGRVCPVWGIDASGRILARSSSEAFELQMADVVAWLDIKLHASVLQQQVFGTLDGRKSWLWNTFISQWWACILTAIAAILINVLTVAGSLYSMQVYDRVIPSDAQNTLLVLTSGVLIAYGFDFLLRTIRASIVDHASKSIDLELSSKVFSQAIGVRMEARPAHIGTFIAQLREHETVREFLLSTTVFVLSDVPFLFIFLIVIWMIGGWLVLVPLAAIPLVVLVTVVVQWPMFKLSRAHLKESSARAGLLIESVEAAETIKTLNAEWRMARRWRELTELVSGTSMKIKGISNFSSNLATAVQSMMYVVIIAAGAILIRKGELTAGALMACSILASRALAPVAQMVMLMARIFQVSASVNMLNRLMALPVDRPAEANFLSLDQLHGGMDLQNVEFNYGGGDVQALNIKDLSIGPGERVALLGRTGSGKSTLLRLLSGLYMPTRGRILMDNVDIHHVDPAGLRRVVGYMTQDVRLLAGSLKENLMFGAATATDDEVIRAAKVTGVDRIAAGHPRGFDLPINEGGGGLSGGQKQAVGMARLLLGKPKVLLLDEPSASMDQQTEREFIERFAKSIEADCTLVIATHKPSILSMVTRVIVLDRGRVVLDGPRDMVLNKLAGAPGSGSAATASPAEAIRSGATPA